MSRGRKLGVFLVSSVMAGAPLAPSPGHAQGAPAGFMNTFIPGRIVSNRRCPGLTWHIDRTVRADQTVSLSGPIWYENGSGMSFATGTGQADGRFSLDVKTMSGDGPAGTITGQRMPDGSIDATSAGPPCFAGTVHLEPGQNSANPARRQ